MFHYKKLSFHELIVRDSDPDTAFVMPDFTELPERVADDGGQLAGYVEKLMFVALGVDPDSVLLERLDGALIVITAVDDTSLVTDALFSLQHVCRRIKDNDDVRTGLLNRFTLDQFSTVFRHISTRCSASDKAQLFKLTGNVVMDIMSLYKSYDTFEPSILFPSTLLSICQKTDHKGTVAVLRDSIMMMLRAIIKKENHDFILGSHRQAWFALFSELMEDRKTFQKPSSSLSVDEIILDSRPHSCQLMYLLNDVFLTSGHASTFFEAWIGNSDIQHRMCDMVVVSGDQLPYSHPAIADQLLRFLTKFLNSDVSQQLPISMVEAVLTFSHHHLTSASSSEITKVPRKTIFFLFKSILDDQRDTRQKYLNVFLNHHQWLESMAKGSDDVSTSLIQLLQRRVHKQADVYPQLEYLTLAGLSAPDHQNNASAIFQRVMTHDSVIQWALDLIVTLTADSRPEEGTREFRILSGLAIFLNNLTGHYEDLSDHAKTKLTILAQHSKGIVKHAVDAKLKMLGEGQSRDATQDTHVLNVGVADLESAIAALKKPDLVDTAFRCGNSEDVNAENAQKVLGSIVSYLYNSFNDVSSDDMAVARSFLTRFLLESVYTNFNGDNFRRALAQNCLKWCASVNEAVALLPNVSERSGLAEGEALHLLGLMCRCLGDVLIDDVHRPVVWPLLAHDTVVDVIVTVIFNKFSQLESLLPLFADRELREALFRRASMTGDAPGIKNSRICLGNAAVVLASHIEDIDSSFDFSPLFAWFKEDAFPGFHDQLLQVLYKALSSDKLSLDCFDNEFIEILGGDRVSHGGLIVNALTTVANHELKKDEYRESIIRTCIDQLQALAQRGQDGADNNKKFLEHELKQKLATTSM